VLVATLVVEAINARYGTSFAPPDVAAIAAADRDVQRAVRDRTAEERSRPSPYCVLCGEFFLAAMQRPPPPEHPPLAH
jgi:hypothetical protein